MILYTYVYTHKIYARRALADGASRALTTASAETPPRRRSPSLSLSLPLPLSLSIYIYICVYIYIYTQTDE